jgi:2-polyprenyl-3-methyl-5-hydroxy-6-metoxy-1,4-benzoquinol methylase
MSQDVNSIIDELSAGLLKLKQALANTHQITIEQEDTKKTTKAPDYDHLLSLLNSDQWPEAVNVNLICDPNSEKDKEDRAISILELLVEESVIDKRFLDMGCGDGYCANQASVEGAKLSVGYDIVSSSSWINFTSDKSLFFDDFSKLKEVGPFDIILIFDVLDHLKNESPVDFLKKAKSLLSKDGKIYMRLHPCTSRHATHLYHDLNKAFVHLVFTQLEMQNIAPNGGIENIGATRPLYTYDLQINESGLKKISQKEIREPIEPFFKNEPFIASRIMKNANFTEFPVFQTELQFVDVILSL